jgi:hypothetical protein
MTAYTGQTQTRTLLGQWCAALWDSWSQPVVTQPGIIPRSVVTPLAPRCSAFDHCTTQEKTISQCTTGIILCWLDNKLYKFLKESNLCQTRLSCYCSNVPNPYEWIWGVVWLLLCKKNKKTSQPFQIFPVQVNTFERGWTKILAYVIRATELIQICEK